MRRFLFLFLWAGLSVCHAQVRQDGDAIVFEGQINNASATEFLLLLQDPQVKRLVITSGGGLVSAALDIAHAVHERQLDVEVPRMCRSSCANYIFPAGRRKLLARPGVVAWHGNMAHVLYLERTGQGTWNASQMADARDLAQREAQLYARLGVDGFVSWFAKIAPYSVEDFYFLQPADMERFGIRDVRVREAQPVTAPDLRPVAVDWARLEADRPPTLAP